MGNVTLGLQYTFTSVTMWWWSCVFVFSLYKYWKPEHICTPCN